MRDRIIKSVGLQLVLVTAALLLTAVLAPTAEAQSTDIVLATGDLIKLADDGNPETNHDAAVYYYGADGKRYVFPNAHTYFTWYEDFSGVRIVSGTQLASIPIGGNVTYRPGTRLVKITSDPKVYAVEPGGILRPIDSEAVAQGLYGDNWNKIIDDVPDAYFFNYQIGAPLSAVVFPSGAVVRTTGGEIYRIEERQKRRISSPEVLAALRVQDRFILDTTDNLSGYPDAEAIANAEPAITDTSQTSLGAVTTIPTFTQIMPATNFAAVGGDTLLMELRLSSVREVRLTQLVAVIKATTGEPGGATADDWDEGGLVFGNNQQANLKLIRWLDENGTELLGTQTQVAVDVNRDQEQTFTFRGNVRIPAGQEKRLRLMGQFNALIPTGEGFQVTVPIEGITLLDGTTGAPADFAPTADITGPNLSTLNSKMKISASVISPMPEYVRGAAKVPVNSLKFEATKEAPNVIKQLTLQGYLDEEGVAGFLPGGDSDNGSESLVREVVPTVYLFAGEEELAGPVSVDLNGKAVFTDLAYHIPAGGSAILTVRGDTNVEHNLESVYDRVMFDIVTAADDVQLTDEKGSQVFAEGDCPNGCDEALSWLSVRFEGKLRFSWQGTSGNLVAGRDIDLGTLTLTPEYDSYDLTTLAFRFSGSHRTIPGPFTLSYPLADDSTATATGQASGDVIVFNNLPAVINGTETLTLSTTSLSRSSGAQYGESVALSLAPADGLRWVSHADDTVFSGSDVGTAEADNFWMGSNDNKAASLLIRWSDVTVEKSEQTPTTIGRNYPVEVYRFDMTSEPEGAIRINKLTFHVVPEDAGSIDNTGAAIPDLLDHWVTVNGDSADEDTLVDLVWLSSSGREEIWGEGAAADLTLKISDADVGLISDPVARGYESGKSDYAVIEYAFREGREIVIPPGLTYTLALRVDTTKYQNDSHQYDSKYEIYRQIVNDGLTVSLESYEFTDITSGAFTPLARTFSGDSLVTVPR
jgi:hypothetical protein